MLKNLFFSPDLVIGDKPTDSVLAQQMAHTHGNCTVATDTTFKNTLNITSYIRLFISEFMFFNSVAGIKLQWNPALRPTRS